MFPCYFTCFHGDHVCCILHTSAISLCLNTCHSDSCDSTTIPGTILYVVTTHMDSLLSVLLLFFSAYIFIFLCLLVVLYITTCFFCASIYSSFLPFSALGIFAFPLPLSPSPLPVSSSSLSPPLPSPPPPLPPCRFVWIMGVSIVYSFKGRKRDSFLSRIYQVIRRTVVLFWLGILLDEREKNSHCIWGSNTLGAFFTHTYTPGAILAMLICLLASCPIDEMSILAQCFVSNFYVHTQWNMFKA